MNGEPTPSASDSFVHTPRRSVVPGFRGDDEIVSVLDAIIARNPAANDTERDRDLAVLDDLAEEMIGRTGTAHLALKARIAGQRQLAADRRTS